MNAAIRAVTRAAIFNGFKVKGIYRGYDDEIRLHLLRRPEERRPRWHGHRHRPGRPAGPRGQPEGRRPQRGRKERGDDPRCRHQQSHRLCPGRLQPGGHEEAVHYRL